MVDISWEQPPLFTVPKAVRIRFDALIDPIEESVVLFIEAREYPTRELLAMISSAPIAWEHVEERAREFGREWTALLREHTGPF